MTTRRYLLTAGHRTYGHGEHPHVGWDRQGERVVFTSNRLGNADVCVATIPREWQQRQTPPPTLEPSLAAAELFLVTLFDPSLNLLPEFAGANVYYLYHDNYLAAHALWLSRPDLAERISKAIVGYGVRESGKIEIVCGEAKQPLPFRVPELVTVATQGEKQVRTERLTTRELAGWEEYADLLLLAALAQADRDRAKANECFQKALGMWDGQGFNDRATRSSQRYAVYKLALALLAARKFKQPLAMEADILRRLASAQDESGGFITDYQADGKPVGKPNVETTSLVILALAAGR